jgi:16S rRNA C967 or C1407 C5-methylase (RsmB/RsmF family)
MLFSPQFITYYREYFFGGNEEEFQKFLTSLEAPLPRTIRIKPGKIGEVKARLESDGWVLHPTLIDHVFSLDRASSFDPLERRIGFSVDHLIGNFYIQELAA